MGGWVQSSRPLWVQHKELGEPGQAVWPQPSLSAVASIKVQPWLLPLPGVGASSEEETVRPGRPRCHLSASGAAGQA